MNNDFIAVIDSGVGGLTVLNSLIRKMPNERFLYFGDNCNAPYGSKSKRELLSLTVKNILYVKSFGVKALVVACNTLSVNFTREIKDISGVPTYYVFPPVESCEISGKKTLLLSTPLTSQMYKEGKNVVSLGIDGLVKDIENNIFDLSKVNFPKWFETASKGGKIKSNTSWDTVILGCTHFPLIKNQIINHLKPRNILNGDVSTVNKIFKDCINSNSLVNIRRNTVFFVGENSIINEEIFNKVVKVLL